MKNELNTRFQKNFTMGSYGVEIGCAWYSQKACEICSSLVQKKKLKRIYFSSHKLPKQQSTNFWSQRILGVKYTFICLLSNLYSSIQFSISYIVDGCAQHCNAQLNYNN
jgi:hypothetical protein